MRTVKVNPGIDRKGNPLKVFKENMVEILPSKEGTTVPRTAFYNRLIKNKDLIIVADVQTPIFKKVEEKTEVAEEVKPSKKSNSKGTKKQKTKKLEE